MAELPMVLYQDHQRLERLFARWHQSPGPDLVTGICDELDVALTTAEELAFPLISGLNTQLAQNMENEHQRVRDLAAEVSEIEPGDPAIGPAMKRLERNVLVHINHVERDVLPLLRKNVHRGELHDLGRNAFTLRQEMLAQLDFRPRLQPLGMPGNGWGSGRLSLNAGW